jgi:tetratricopeptide (TPR) repeat protein
MKYDDFSVHLDPAPDGSCAVSVRSPRGEGHGTFEIPPFTEPVRGQGETWNRQGAFRHLAAPFTVAETPGLDQGKELFQALFRGEPAGLFHASLAGLREDQGLRINIEINPRCPETALLQQLPWEQLCRPETEDFLCLSRQTPVVRSPDAHRERRPAIARPSRIRILAVSASPSDHVALDVARERKHLEEAWKGQENHVEIVFLEGGGLATMRQALLAKPFHILHFMGHGEFDEETGQGSLLFEKDDGTGHLFEGRHLAQLLRDCATLRLVVLNACHTAEAVGTYGPSPFSGVASALVMGGVPAVVAMSGPVSDAAAVAFSRTFYERLACGDPIEAAMTEGRLAIQRAAPDEGAWATPVLFLRSPDGSLFAPRSAVWARRAALLAGATVALALIGILGSGWLGERRTSQVMRLNQDGVGFQELGRNKEALQSLSAAQKLDKSNPVPLNNRAVVEMQLGDDEAALAHLQEAAKADPDNSVLHYNLGNLLARKKRYEEAIPSLLRAIEIEPCYANAFNELGNVYLDLDHAAEARKAFEAGLSCEPSQAKLHKNLARTALTEGNRDEAIEHLDKALSLYPPSDSAGRTEATYWLAVAQATSGRRKEACAELRKLEVFDPQGLSPFAKKATLLREKQRCAPWP